MKLNLSLWTWLSLQVILIFMVAIVVSFIPDYIPDFFGDWFCKGWMDGGPKLCDHANNYHNPCWHWGYRHWLFATMGLFMFAVQAARIITQLDKPNKSNED